MENCLIKLSISKVKPYLHIFGVLLIIQNSWMECLNFNTRFLVINKQVEIQNILVTLFIKSNIIFQITFHCYYYLIALSKNLKMFLLLSGVLRVPVRKALR